MEIITDSVNKQMYELLRWEILSGKYKVGERIDSKGIAKENGVSVMPVRNALQRLTSDGLVVNKERVGFYVKEFTASEIAEIIDARKMFEVYCLSTYFTQINEERARQLYDKFECYDELTPDALSKLDSELHRMFVEISNNSILMDTYEKLSAMFSLGYFVGYENTDIANQEHLAILEAVLKKDKVTAVDELEKHLERVHDEITTLYNNRKNIKEKIV